MSETNKPAGYYIRYLPAVYQWSFEEAQKNNSELSLTDFVATLDDTGEELVVRVYEDEDEQPLIIFARTMFGDGIPEKEKAIARVSFGESLLRRVFDSNKMSFSFRGIKDFDSSEVAGEVYGVPVEVYLSSYWVLLERAELFEIGDKDFGGFVETDRGKKLLYSL